MAQPPDVQLTELLLRLNVEALLAEGYTRLDMAQVRAAREILRMRLARSRRRIADECRSTPCVDLTIPRDCWTASKDEMARAAATAVARTWAPAAAAGPQ